MNSGKEDSGKKDTGKKNSGKKDSGKKDAGRKNNGMQAVPGTPPSNIMYTICCTWYVQAPSNVLQADLDY
jgi:hypothetical protein